MTKEELIRKYVMEKHTQEECIGFIDGHESRNREVKHLETLISDQAKVNAELYSDNEALKKELKDLREELAYYKRKQTL